MKKRLAGVWLCVLFLAGMASQAWAQGNKATINGKVTDSSGAVLQGARVQIQPSGATAVSDELGAFSIADVAPGKYTLTVSYVGFDPFTSTLTVEENATPPTITAQLKLSSQNQSVIVTGERPRGDAEAVNRVLSADNITEVLPAAVITSLPNANVADAVGRLASVTLERIEGEGVYVNVRGTEPRLTNVTIDGITVPSPEPDVNQIRLDVVPADLLESVEVNKTLEPDMDGDGIGGSVNIKTKTAGQFPTISLEALGGYDPIMGGRPNDQFNGTIGHRFGQKKKLGLLFGGTYDFNGRGIDNFQPAIDPASTFAAPIYDNNTIREYRYYRNRWGYAGTADYEFSPETSIYFKGLYSNLQDYGDKWYYEPQSSGSPKFYTSSKRPDASISSYTLGGTSAVSDAQRFTWELSAARSFELDSAGNPKADFSWIGAKLTCGYSAAAQSNPLVPHFGSGCDLANTPLQVASNWGFKDITTSTGLSGQVNLAGSASYTLDYDMNGHLGILQFGGKFRTDHKYQDASENVYDGWNAATYPMTNFLNNFSSSNYMSGYYFGGHFGPVSDFNVLQSYTLANLGGFLDGYKTASDTYPNIFDIIERIGAGYVMDTMEVGRWHIVGGVRVEDTSMNTLGYNVTLYPAGSKNCATATGCGVPVPVYNQPQYVNYLPSVSAHYQLTSDSDFRLAYGRGVSRPDLYQMVPYLTEDDSTNPATIAEGNPALQPEHANNYDALYEHSLNHTAGLIQAGFFYKQLSDTLISTSYTAASGQYLGDLISQWINTGSAHLYGFEASYEQRLSMLPGPLAGLGMFANYSWTGSRVLTIPGRADSPALQQQVPSAWNISPTYDRGPVSFRVGLAYNGACIYQYEYQTSNDPNKLGPTGPLGDVYTLPHFQVDAQTSIKLAHGLTAVVYGLNLNDEVFGYYNGSPVFVNQREWYKPTYAAGLKWTFNGER